MLKCYKIVLKIKSIIKNYGFFIISSILVLYFLSLFIFWCVSYAKLKKDVNKMISILKKKETTKEPKEIKDNRIIKKAVKKKKNERNRKKNKRSESFKFNNENKENEIKNNKHKGKKYSEQITQSMKDNSINQMNILNIINDKNIKELIEQKDFEINALEYEEALKIDHRNYFQYYISLLKYNHPLIFSFGSYKDYNSRIIKIFLFFFSFSLDFTINALFFSDDTMHKIYEDKGKYNLLFQLPQIIYSTLISRFIDALIKYLALSQDLFIEIKKEKDKKNLDNKYIKKVKQTLKFKLILFFLIVFIILVFFLYYITCFCGIYENTQIHLINDSLISLATSLILPFILYLIPGIFRIPSLRVKKPTRSGLYKLSKILQYCLW